MFFSFYAFLCDYIKLNKTKPREASSEDQMLSFV